MKEIRRRNLKYLALEAVVVLFGVLAALLVDGFRDEAGRQEAADAAVERLFVEAAQNLDELLDFRDDVAGRLERLRALRSDAPADVALIALAPRFGGYASLDLSEGAWERLARSDLANSVDPELLEEAFYIYERHQWFDALTLEIYSLVFGEIFYLPERTSTGIAISQGIMEQQIRWANELVPLYENLLTRATP